MNVSFNGGISPCCQTPKSSEANSQENPKTCNTNSASRYFKVKHPVTKVISSYQQEKRSEPAPLPAPIFTQFSSSSLISISPEIIDSDIPKRASAKSKEPQQNESITRKLEYLRSITFSIHKSECRSIFMPDSLTDCTVPLTPIPLTEIDNTLLLELSGSEEIKSIRALNKRKRDPEIDISEWQRKEDATIISQSGSSTIPTNSLIPPEHFADLFPDLVKDPGIPTPPKRNRSRIQPNERNRICKKEPQIIGGCQIEINGVYYPITQIGSGHNHRVFAFDCETVIIINEKEIPLNKVILRTFLPYLDVRKIKANEENNYIAYDKFLSNKIPMPICYLKPNEFVDSQNPKSGGFWLLERMSKNGEVTLDGWRQGQPFSELCDKDKKVLEFVHYWLKKSFQEKCTLIPSLYDRNVMWDNDGNLKIVDFSLSIESWEEELETFICHWSAGNKSVEEYLRTAAV